MPALSRLPQADACAHIATAGQAPSWNERIIQGVKSQCWNADAVQVGLGRRSQPVIFGVFEAMQWRGENVVKSVKIPRCQQGCAAVQTGVLVQLFQRLGHHGSKKHAGVNLPVETAPYCPAAGRQIKRRAHASNALHDAAGVALHLAGPTHQGVSTERYADCDHRAAALGLEAAKYPVDLLKIARMVGARAMVQFPRAAAKMWDRTSPSPRVSNIGKRLGVVAAG